jgi:hypothetical protein
MIYTGNRGRFQPRQITADNKPKLILFKILGGLDLTVPRIRSVFKLDPNQLKLYNNQ